MVLLVAVAATLAVSVPLMLRSAKISSECSIEESYQFSQWKIENNKVYSSPAEQSYRFGVFCSNLKRIRAHNSLGTSSYSLALNFYADYTHKEYAAIYGKGDFVSSVKESTPEIKLDGLGDIVLPDNVDWSKTSDIDQVYDVKKCTGGYAFAAKQVLEAAKILEKGDRVRLSPQNIIDCSSEVPYTNSGCDGGCVFMGLRYVKEQGVATDADYPYTSGASGSSSYCQAQIARPYKISNFYSIPSGRSDILKNLVSNKPVVVTVDIEHIDPFLSTGIYDGNACTTTSTTYYLLLVGYGIDTIVQDKSKSRYWKIKNHRGDRWGNGGYAKIIRSEGPVPAKCGITDNGVYVQI
jgi:hypothetical protein